MRLLTWVQGMVLGAGVLPCTLALGDPAEEIAFFETHIRPILIDRCYECHAADQKVKGLSLIHI